MCIIRGLGGAPVSTRLKTLPPGSVAEWLCSGLQIRLRRFDSKHMREAVKILRELTGQHPLGWYTGRDSPNTRSSVVEHGGFLYDSDNYGDDLPFWAERNYLMAAKSKPN